MKLEAGQFVRTKDGEIHKIKSINDEYIEYENGFGIPYELKEYIVKASYSIIDILEVGDYVNGRKVIDKWEEPDWYGYFIKLDGEETTPTIRHIKSVITHEQMEQMAYKVVE